MSRRVYTPRDLGILASFLLIKEWAFIVWQCLAMGHVWQPITASFHNGYSLFHSSYFIYFTIVHFCFTLVALLIPQWLLVKRGLLED